LIHFADWWRDCRAAFEELVTACVLRGSIDDLLELIVAAAEYDNEEGEDAGKPLESPVSSG